METIIFKKEIAQAHIDKLLTQYKIKVKAYSVSSSGRAWIDQKLIKIPHPTNIDRFCVCMHEIKHIIDGKWGRLYEMEFACEMFAIEQAELLGFDCSEYRERARRYIIMNISKGFCRGLNLKNISPEIKAFCQIDFEEWQGKKIFVKNWGKLSNKMPLEIQMQ